jgi:type I restriction enzyme S subunit
MSAVEVEGGGIARPVVRRYEEVKKGYTAFSSGDVIMAKITPCMENGKTTVVPPLPNPICFGSTEFHVFRPEVGVDARWISYYLLRMQFRKYARLHMAGSAGQLRVPSHFLETVQLPIAPISEQHRVLDAIEESLSDLDAGIEALRRVQIKLKQYRSAVLKAAVSGELTAQWRREHPNVQPAAELLKRILAERRRLWEEAQQHKFEGNGKVPPKNWQAKYREPTAPDTSKLPQLPDNWCWSSLDQLGQLDRGRSRHRPRDAAFLYGGPYPFIQTGDVRRASQYIREHSQTYSEAGLKQSRLWPEGTLCITIAANIAETAILSYPACFPDSVVGVIFNRELVSVRYVEMFLRTVKGRLHAFAPATAQKNINNDVLRTLAVPLPPYQEQLAIVEAAEAQLSVIEHLELDTEEKTRAADALRQAILHHAFIGRLVPQDPTDEPASELLKRIAAERAQRAEAAQVARRSATPKRARKNRITIEQGTP